MIVTVNSKSFKIARKAAFKAKGRLYTTNNVIFSPPPPLFSFFPSLLFLLSLIFLRHNKDGGYNSTNINKQLSPAQNTPALQATYGCDH